MSTIDTPYTPLETLLLFQSLAAYGVEPTVFSRISDLLKGNPHITSSDRFEVGRLSPDSLRNWYLKLLKREVQNETQAHDGTNGDGESYNGEVQNPRKRKAPSPSFPTVQEASQHTHLIPKLVAKLYSSYRSYITEHIRDDERRYDRLQRDLQEIERGEWDNRLQPQETNGTGKTSARQTQTPTKNPPPRDTPDAHVPPTTTERPGSTEHATSKPADTRNGQPILQPAIQPVPDESPFIPTPSINEGPPTTPQLAQSGPHHPTGHIRPPSQPQGAPRPPSQYPRPGYTTSPTTVHRSPYPPQPHSGQFPISSASPIPQNAVLAGHPLSPGGLPPHPGQYPPLPPSPYSTNGVPQYSGPPAGHLQYSPNAPRYHGTYPLGQTSPGPLPASQTPQQQRGYYPPYQTHQTPYPPTQQQPQAVPIQQYMLPPFQVTPQDPIRAHQQQQRASQQTQASTPSNRQPLTPSQATAGVSQSLAQPQFPPRAIPGHLQHQFSTPSTARGGSRPSLTISTPSSATRWKPSAEKPPRSPRRSPSWSPVSEVEDHVELPAEKTPSVSKSTGKRKSKAKDPPRTEDISGDVGMRTMRSGRTQATRTRGGSTASSVVGSSIRGRTRSQSVVSHAETMSADHEASSGYQVKTEPEGSADIPEEGSVGAGNTVTAATRRRGVTLPSLQSNKRKRHVRETSVADSEDLPRTPGPQMIVAPRHFSRMCNPIMNDILSHKHASLFSGPVKERDAEGYYDIIKRPQDLKSIKTAITAGAKLVQAAASSDTPAGSPGGAGGNVMLPAVEVSGVIVNSAQLEKELMRMFANAVMFNTGDDGVVQDAKEMYETVEKSVTTWRSSAERATGRMESEDPGVEDETPATMKRRKV